MSRVSKAGRLTEILEEEIHNESKEENSHYNEEEEY